MGQRKIFECSGLKPISTMAVWQTFIIRTDQNMLSSQGSLRVLFVAMVLMASAILIPLGTSQFKVDSLVSNPPLSAAEPSLSRFGGARLSRISQPWSYWGISTALAG
jgi:hypothetical protein